MTVYNIDAFDNPASTVASLRDRGFKAIAYISAGTYEDWRPDAARLPLLVLGKNVDANTQNTELPITFEDQLGFNIWLAEEAHKKELAVSLKNDVEQIPQLVDFFDFRVNEQCFEYAKYDTLRPFLDDGKAVFSIEYSRQCFRTDLANSLRMNTLLRDLNLTPPTKPI